MRTERDWTTALKQTAAAGALIFSQQVLIACGPGGSASPDRKATTTSSVKRPTPIPPNIPTRIPEISTGNPVTVRLAKDSQPTFTTEAALVQNQDGNIVVLSLDGRPMWTSAYKGNLLGASDDMFVTQSETDGGARIYSTRTRALITTLEAGGNKEKYKGKALIFADNVAIPHKGQGMGEHDGFTVFNKEGRKLWGSGSENFTLLNISGHGILAGSLTGTEGKIHLFDTATGVQKLSEPGSPSLGTKDQFVWAQKGNYLAIVNGSTYIPTRRQYRVAVYDLKNSPEPKTLTIQPGYWSTIPGIQPYCNLYCNAEFTEVSIIESRQNAQELLISLGGKIGTTDHFGHSIFEYNTQTRSLRISEFFSRTQTRRKLVDDGENRLYFDFTDARREVTTAQSMTTRADNLNVPSSRVVKIYDTTGSNQTWSGEIPANSYLGKYGDILVLASWDPKTGDKTSGNLTVTGVRRGASGLETVWKADLSTQKPAFPVRVGNDLFVAGEALVKVAPASGQISKITSLAETITSGVLNLQISGSRALIHTADNRFLSVPIGA